MKKEKPILSVADLNAKYRNKNAKHSDFPVGTKVRIVTACRDFHFWYRETGTVVVNRGEGSYLGIKVKLDVPRTYEGGWPDYREWTMTEFNFQPEDLRRLKPKKTLWMRCKECLGKGKKRA